MSRAALAKQTAAEGHAFRNRGPAPRNFGSRLNQEATPENPVSESHKRDTASPRWSFSEIKTGVRRGPAASQAPRLSSASRVLDSPGQPLDSTTRTSMESRFGHNFSRVRVHADSQAAEAARAAGAGAFTVGDHVAFSSGFYSPQTQGGRVVLAHELAHVVQQANSSRSSAPTGPKAESEALSAGEAMRRPGGPIRIGETARLGLAAMSIAEARRALWSHVPEKVKDYVRPVAQEAAAQMDKVIPPNTEIPKPIEHLAEHPIDTLVQAAENPVEAIRGVSETVEAVKPAAKKAVAAIPHLVKEKVKQKVHDSVMDTLGEAKGVVLEATNIVDTVAWLPYAAHEAERKLLGTGETANTIIAVTDFMSNYGALEYLVKKGYAAKDPITGKPTGAFSISGAVSQGIDKQANKLDAALGDGKPEESLAFTSYELGELKGAIGTQVGLAFVGVEEVQLVLKGIGAIGAAKNVVDAIEANPKGWSTDVNFWSGLIGLVLTVIGLGSARASQKITKIILAGAALVGVVPLVSKLYHDFKQLPEGAERDKTLKQDFEGLIKAITNVVMSVVHPGGKAKGGEGEQPSAVRGGEAAPGEQVAPTQESTSVQQAQLAAPAENATTAPAKPAQPVAESTAPVQAASPKVTEAAAPKSLPADQPGPVVEPPLKSDQTVPAAKAQAPAESVSAAPVESTAPASTPKAVAQVEPPTSASAPKVAAPVESTAPVEAASPKQAPQAAVASKPLSATAAKGPLTPADIEAMNLRNKANVPKLGGEAPKNPDRTITREQWKQMESERRWANAVDAWGESFEENASTSKVTGTEKSGYYIEDTKVPGKPNARLDIDADTKGKDASVPKRAGETSREAVVRIKTVIGRKISQIPQLEKLWNDARASVLSRRTLTAKNYAELYDATRDAFWRRVGGKTSEGAAARQVLQDAGFTADQGQKNAPRLTGADPSLKRAETTISLDHLQEKAIDNNWMKALDADNLQLEFAMPNTDREIRQARHPELRPGANLYPQSVEPDQNDVEKQLSKAESE